MSNTNETVFNFGGKFITISKNAITDGVHVRVGDATYGQAVNLTKAETDQVIAALILASV